MSNIFKKITNIEPDEADILDAIKAAPKAPPETPAKKGLGLSSIEEENVDTDPVPDFITREDKAPKEDIFIESPTPETIIKEEPIQKVIDDIPSKADRAISDEILTPQEKSKLSAPTALGTAVISGATLETQSMGWMKWAGIIGALIWIAASFSYFYGFFELRQKWTDLSPMQISGLIMAILLPAILLAMLFYALRQLSKLSVQSQNLQRAAYQLTQPNESLVAKTHVMSEVIKTEVDSIDARIEQALARMKSLEDVLAERTQSLVDATGNATQTTDEIASRISTQRLALESIAGTFDDRMNMLSTSLTEHTTKLDNSTKLAEQKIQEARISVEDATQRINDVSSVVRGNTVDAASTLTQSHEEIESLANMIRERSAELDEVYRKHARDLTGMIGELRDEQQNLSLSLDERLSKMRDMSLSAKVSAESLREASDAGKNTVEALAEAARLTDTAVKQRFSEMEDMVKFSNEKATNISDQASARVQDRLAQTRKEISRIEDDMLAMQSRLAEPKTRQDTLALDEPKQPTQKRKSRIKLKPIEEEDTPLIETPATNDELDIPALRTSPISSQVAHEEELTLEIDDQYVIDESEDLTLSIEETNIIQPVETPSETKKERSGWRWRDMLGGLERPGTASSDEALNVAPPKQRNISDARMIASLSALGLSPTVIVDDGCIIEATNTRLVKGASAMSPVVTRRLGTPIRHLHRSMEENPSLKADAQAYTAQFNNSLASIETDREAIRNSLETDAGRAFLLCDAALNG